MYRLGCEINMIMRIGRHRCLLRGLKEPRYRWQQWTGRLEDWRAKKSRGPCFLRFLFQSIRWEWSVNWVGPILDPEIFPLTFCHPHLAIYILPPQFRQLHIATIVMLEYTIDCSEAHANSLSSIQVHSFEVVSSVTDSSKSHLAFMLKMGIFY